jgi:hypothetical protein
VTAVAAAKPTHTIINPPIAAGAKYLFISDPPSVFYLRA